jgi:endonuclease/exonuclease/phosphatase (EEP) superfamily protein YafD
MMQRLRRAVAEVAVAYASAIVVWQILRLAAGDRWWWLASANVLSLYLFLPLLALVPLAWLARQRAAIVSTTVPAAILVLLYGGLFLPSMAPPGVGDAETFRVMTLNVLYTNDDGAAIERLVRAKQPDLICLQELNPRLAADLVARLGHEFPYHALLPEEDPTGLGMFSRYPLRDSGEIPDPAWKHGAQLAMVAFQGQPVLVLNVHALSPTWPRLARDWPPRFEAEFQLREQEIRLWLDRMGQHHGPAILAGDLNSTDQNASHRLLARRLADAHRQAGWGLGHTAPASVEGLDRVPSPSRLFRIDYVWHSDHWQTLDAHVGEWDGQSDHLPVFATLQLQAE